MQFLHPSFLWALLALAVPIVIHLFNFRRFKTVYFSNVKFLKEISEETTSRSRLKHLLVLAARLLALSFLVFAFAQPFIPNKQQTLNAGKKLVSIYIDNSFSMNAVSHGQSLLDKAKQTAGEIVKSFAPDDEFQLLTNDFEGKHQRMVGKEEFLTMLDEVEPSPAVRTLADITTRQKEALQQENNTNKSAYLISDFQKSLGTFSVDSTVAYHLIPLAADAQANVYIDTCWFNEPAWLVNRQLTLIVRVNNSGEKEVSNNRLVFKLNGQTKAMSELAIAAGSFTYDTIRFTTAQAGWNKAELSVADYPITYDDNYYITFKAADKIRVAALNESASNQFLNALFQNQTEFEYVNLSAALVQPEQLQGNRLIIVNGLNTISPTLSVALSNYIADGGAVAVFPGERCDLDNYNRFLNNLGANSITGLSEQAQDIGSINLQQNLFNDVFEKVPENISLPHVKKYYTFSQSSISSEETLLRMKDGASFLSVYPYKDGVLYLCAVPLSTDFSELPVHAIFVPLLYKMAISHLQHTQIAYRIGDKTRIEVEGIKASGESVYEVKGADVAFIPQQFAVGNKILLGLNDQVRQAGFYTVTMERTPVNELLALNYDRKESDLTFFTAKDLALQYSQKNVSIVNGAGTEVAAVVKELNRGTALWKWCLILSLLFLAIEIGLLRFWKV